MASPVAPGLRWRSPSAGRQGGRTRGSSGPMAARTTSEGGSGLRRMIRSRTPHEVPAGAARVGDEVGGVVDGVGEDDGVAEPVMVRTVMVRTVMVGLSERVVGRRDREA